MSAGRCELCGAAARGGERYCSTGCDLARRLPMGEVAMPASRELGGLLLWCFLHFNQWLMAAVSWLASGKGELETAQRFTVASWAAGGLTLVGGAILLALARPKRLSDAGALGAAAALAALASRFLGNLPSGGSAFVFSIFNLLMVMWLTRGLWKLGASKNR